MGAIYDTDTVLMTAKLAMDVYDRDLGRPPIPLVFRRYKHTHWATYRERLRLKQTRNCLQRATDPQRGPLTGLDVDGPCDASKSLLCLQQVR
jgi:hypothetical protein